jgi:hypothetical protein
LYAVIAVFSGSGATLYALDGVHPPKRAGDIVKKEIKSIFFIEGPLLNKRLFLVIIPNRNDIAWRVAFVKGVF